MSSTNRSCGFKDSQLLLLNQKFRSQQKLSLAEVKQLTGETKLSEKQVRTWFANKRRQCKQNKKSTAFSKVPKVSVLMDMDTIKALQRSIAKTENILQDEENESFQSTSLSEMIPFIEKPEIPRNKICTKTKTNVYIENLLQRVEELESVLKEREGDIYVMQKDLNRSRDDLETKERVLKTIQQSIPKVVSDHRKILEEKDIKILELENRLDSSERANTELRAKLETIRKDGKCFENKNELESLENQNSEYKLTIIELNRNLAEKETALEKNSELEKSIQRLEHEKVSLMAEFEKRNRELNLMKYKESQCLQLERTLSETMRILAQCKEESSELRMKEVQSAEKISELEFEVHSRSVELNSLGDLVKRLNDKVRTSNINPDQKIQIMEEDVDLTEGHQILKRRSSDLKNGMDVVASVLSEIISRTI